MNNVIKPPTVLPAAMKKNTLVKSFRFPASTFLINDNNDCWTSDGKNGICSPSRSCYLNKRLQEPNDIKFNRFQPSRNGCRYFNSFGQQVIRCYTLGCLQFFFTSAKNNELPFKTVFHKIWNP